MHVQTSVKVVETILLQVLVKKRIAIHLTIHTIVANYVWIQLQATCSRCVVLRVCAIARPRITLTNVTHVHILVHHAAISPV